MDFLSYLVLIHSKRLNWVIFAKLILLYKIIIQYKHQYRDAIKAKTKLRHEA